MSKFDPERLERALARLGNSDAATAWLQKIGLTARGCHEIGLGLDREEDGSLLFIYLHHSRDGTRTLQEISIGPDGQLVKPSGTAPSLHWSAPSLTLAPLVVVPDLFTFWLLVARLGKESAASWNLVTSLSGLASPIEWTEPSFWGAFSSIYLVVDRPEQGGKLLERLSGLIDIEVGVAGAPDAAGWRSFLAQQQSYTSSDLQLALDDAVDVSAFVSAPQPGCGFNRRDFRPHHIHDLDKHGRLCRLVHVEQERITELGGRTRIEHSIEELVVRSDRRLLDLAQLPAPSRSSAARIWSLPDGARIDKPRSAAGALWSLESIGRYLCGHTVEPPQEGRQLAGRLQDALACSSSCSLAVAGQAASFVMASFVYQLFDYVPLIIMEGGRVHVRARLSRAIALLSHNGLLVGRRRGLELARSADRSGGAIILDEPGPLVGPGGPTEVGRFLLSSMLRDCSLEVEHDPLLGSRTLHTFGPRLIFRSRSAPVPLTPDEIIIQIEEDDGNCVRGKPEPLDGLRDDLYRWSMEIAQSLADQPSPSGDLFAWIRQLSGVEPTMIAAPVKPEVIGTLDEILSSALEECRASSGLVISSAQLSFAASLRGLQPDQYSPERLGRWLSATGQLDEFQPVTRRRLFGQIVRIYNLRQRPGETPSAKSPFAFCDTRACIGCRYAAPCAQIAPELRKKKRG